ncbi:MAG: hypothetical protein GF307_14810 [candidate division Zixibacteria bacterium]|nr:hypothetical protein [candidate division Zixibacteria bacterium]
MKKAVFWLVLKAIVAIVIMGYLINRIEFARLLDVMKHANPFYIGLAVALAPLNIFWIYNRWRYLIRYLDPHQRISRGEIFGSALSGATLRLSTPGGLGEPGRIFYIRTLGRMRLLALSLLDNVSAIIVTICFGSVGVAYTLSIPILYILPFFLLAGIAVVLRYRKKINIDKLTFLPERFRRYDFWEVPRDIPANKLGTVVLMAAAMYIGFSAQYYLFILAFEKLSVIDGAMSIFSVWITKSLFPISLGDLGIRESVAIFYLSKYDISAAAALNASLMLFTVNLLFPAIIGSVFLTRFKLHSTEVENDEN